MTERETNSHSITTQTSERPDFPEGFLLFDMQAIQLKEWKALNQSPEITGLNKQFEQLSIKSQELPAQASLINQKLLNQSSALNRDLIQAREKARGIKITTRNPKRLKAKLYRIVKFFSSTLADQIIPYQSAVRKVVEVRNAKRNVEQQRREINRVTAQNHTAIDREKVGIDAEVQGLLNNWLFSNPKRILLHALTYLNHDTETRNLFFSQYSQHAGVDFNDIREAYNQLAAKAMPSTNASRQLEATLQEAYTQQISDEVSEGFKSAVFTKPKVEFQIPPKDNGHQGDYEKTNQLNRKVIIHVSKNSAVNLEDIPEGEFDDIVRKSNTPLSPQQITEIIEHLACTDEPLKEYQRYPFVVKEGSEFKGYHVLKKGSMGRVLFKFSEDNLFIRFGGYFQVYAHSTKLHTS